MRRVVARVSYGVAILALAISFLGIRRASDDVFAYAIELPEGIPAVLYEPGPPRSHAALPPDEVAFPTVVLGHALAADRSSLDLLARRLTRAGYAVVTFDFRGHGRNRAPYGRVREGRGGLLEDLSAVVAYVRAHPRLDGLRLAVGGHSLGAATALRYASYESGVGAVIGISGGTFPDGPYPVQNLLLIWGQGDSGSTRTGLAPGAGPNLPRPGARRRDPPLRGPGHRSRPHPLLARGCATHPGVARGDARSR
jgi:pimeloyl-ACP methyl ester carboxylesterase